MRSDRNLYSKNLIESQDEIAEMKRKFKIMNHQIEQLKEEIEAKDQVGTPPLSPPTPLPPFLLTHPPVHPLSPLPSLPPPLTCASLSPTHPSHPPTLTLPSHPPPSPRSPGGTTGLRQGAHRALEGGQG